MDDAHITVEDITLRRPTLDEVFLVLTGRPAQPFTDDHFASKEGILMVLHLRLQEFGLDALSPVGHREPTPARWADRLDKIVGSILAHRKIFLLRQRDQAALEALPREEHDAQHEDLQANFERVLSDRRLSVRDRGRMAASFGAVLGGISCPAIPSATYRCRN